MIEKFIIFILGSDIAFWFGVYCIIFTTLIVVSYIWELFMVTDESKGSGFETFNDPVWGKSEINTNFNK